MLSQFQNAKVLSFGAHPDDIEIGCGGVELKLAEQGCEIHHAIFTSGEEGSLNPNKKTLAELREKEAIAAAKVIGTKSIHFFKFLDGLTGFTKDMKLEVITHIRKIQPDIILVHAPDDDQPDHQVCSKLVMDSIGSAAGPWFPDAKGGPHKPKLVLGYEVWSPISRPTMTINISKFIEKKKEAINQHKSQIKDLDYTKAISALADYRGLTAKDNEPAEAFNVLYIGDF